MPTVDCISVVILQEPFDPPDDETLWAIPGEEDPGRDSVPIAYEHPGAIKLFGPAPRSIVDPLADRLVEMLNALGIRTIRATFPGD